MIAPIPLDRGPIPGDDCTHPLGLWARTHAPQLRRPTDQGDGRQRVPVGGQHGLLRGAGGRRLPCDTQVRKPRRSGPIADDPCARGSLEDASKADHTRRTGDLPQPPFPSLTSRDKHSPLRRTSFRRVLASGLRDMQPANTNRERTRRAWTGADRSKASGATKIV